MVKIYCQVLGTKTLDSDPSILLFFDNKRYLFNAGEGTMRFCTEHKIRLSKISQIFLTELRPESIGGLAGLMLTMADTHIANPMTHTQKMQVDVFGPPNSLFYLSTLRSFVKRSELLIALHEATMSEHQKEEQLVFQDDNLRVEAIVVPGSFKKETMTMDNLHPENTFLKSFVHRAFNSSKATDDEPEAKRRRLTASSEQNSNNTLFSYRDKLNILVNEDSVCKVYGTCSPQLINPITDKDYCVSYICHTPVLPGKFDAKKAKELGLKPGPLYGQLSRGEPVTLENGVVITPEQVVGASRPGPILAIVSCPSISFLHNLINDEKWKPYMTTEQQISVMIHTTPDCIAEDKLYIDFMKKFNKNCQHIMINRTHSADRCVFNSSATLQCKLNLIDNDIFGIPRTMEQNSSNHTVGKFNATPVDTIKTKLGKGYQVWESENLLKFTLEPQAQFGIEKSSTFIPHLNSLEIQKEFSKESHPIFNQLVEKYKANKSQILSRLAQTNDEREKMIMQMTDAEQMEIVFLGTGAALPSKYRNVSAILLNSPESAGGAILMDCGEGTLGQLYRVYGKDIADDIILNKLNCVWLSHMHADHHLGLTKILYRRCQLHMERQTREPLKKLIVVGPTILLQFLHEQEICCYQPAHSSECITNENERVTLSKSYQFVLINNLTDPNHAEKTIVEHLYKTSSSQAITGDAAKSVGMTRFYNIAVDHSCRNSYGLVIEFNNKLKIVYSGDTRPCQQLVEAGRNATVLIHEATFEDTLQDEAIKKKHSTTKEAVTIGMQMNAYRILLTHFSQRYPKVPVFDDEDMKGDLSSNRTSIAFDMMRLKMSHLPYAPAVIPAVQELFAEEIAEQQKE